MKLTRHIALAATAAAIALQGQGAPTGAQRADSIAAYVVANNPGLQLMQQRAKADILTIEAENTLAAPEVEFAHQWGTKGIGNKWSIDVKQSFDWPSLYSARAKAAKAQSLADDSEYIQAYNDVSLQTLDAIASLVYCNKRLELVNRMHRHMNELATKVREGYQHGEMTILDVKKADYELFSLGNRVADLTVERSEALAKLAEINGSAVDQAVDLNEYPTAALLPTQEYIDQASSSNLAYLTARNQAQARRDEAEVARLSRYPGFSVGLNHEYEMGDNFNGFSVGITLPVFSGKKRREAALILADTYDTEAEAARNVRCAKVVNLHGRAATLAQRMQASQQLFSADNSYPTLLQKAYKGGELSIITYLQEINYYIEASLEYLDTEYQYNTVINQLKHNI